MNRRMTFEDVCWLKKQVSLLSNFRCWNESKVWCVIHALTEWLIHTFLYRPHRKINNGTHSLQNNAPRHSNLKRSNYFKKLPIQCCILECLLKLNPILSACRFYVSSGRATKSLAVMHQRRCGQAGSITGEWPSGWHSGSVWQHSEGELWVSKPGIQNTSFIAPERRVMIKGRKER